MRIVEEAFVFLGLEAALFFFRTERKRGRALQPTFSFHRYMRPTCHRPISCVINEVALSMWQTAVFFPSTDCREEKIDRLHFSLMLLCPGCKVVFGKEHHLVCLARDGTEATSCSDATHIVDWAAFDGILLACQCHLLLKHRWIHLKECADW